MKTPAEKDHLVKALEIATRLTLIVVLLLASLWVFSPFAMVLIWGIVLAITFDPLVGKLQRLLGGKKKLSAILFVILCLAVFIVPTALLTDSLLEATVELRRQAEAGTLAIPPPTDKVRDWPVIGERVYTLWKSASVDLEGTARQVQPQLQELGRKIIALVSGLGGALVQTVFAIIIAGVLMVTSLGHIRTVRGIASRLGGEQGLRIVDLSVATIRNVVKGVVLVALIQGMLAAVGLAIAGVPFTGLWTVLIAMLAVMQLPPLLVLGPIIPWVFAHHDSTLIAIFFTIWSILVSFCDPFLKMLLLGRGVGVPMPVILIGAIGGMFRAGMVGLFLGPVILAIFYQLFTAWLRQDEAASAPRVSSE